MYKVWVSQFRWSRTVVKRLGDRQDFLVSHTHTHTVTSRYSSRPMCVTNPMIADSPNTAPLPNNARSSLVLIKSCLLLLSADTLSAHGVCTSGCAQTAILSYRGIKRHVNTLTEASTANFTKHEKFISYWCVRNVDIFVAVGTKIFKSPFSTLKHCCQIYDVDDQFLCAAVWCNEKQLLLHTAGHVSDTGAAVNVH